MYYHTPDTTRYITLIRRFRIIIITLFVLFSTVALTLLKPELVSSDTMLWLSESKQLQKTQQQSYSTAYVGHLTITIPLFDDARKNSLQALQTEFEHMEGVEQVESLFSAYMIFNDQSTEESALVKALPITNMGAMKIKAFVKTLPDPYRRFVSDDFHRFHFIIHSKNPIQVDQLTIPFEYEYSNPDIEAKTAHYLWYIAIIVLVVFAMSYIIFKNAIAALGAISVIVITLIWTFSLIYLLTGNRQIHIAMSLMVISIAIGHYLYFYYRWHVSQFKNDPNRALEKSINRNLHPAVWTLPVLFISLGSLLFADSSIVTMMSLSLMISSIVAYIVSIVFLPALLSFFTVLHPRIALARICYWFANQEVHYNPKLLQKFMLLTLLVFLFIGFRLYTSPTVFERDVACQTITLKVPFKEIDLGMLQKIETFEYDLRHYNKGVVKVDSVVTILKRLDLANIPQNPMDEQRLLQALFFLELYDLQKSYIDEDSLNITISLKNADQSAVIHFLESYKALPIYLTDIDSLSQSSKMEKMVLLISSLFSALLIIALVMGMIFRSVAIGWVGFASNAIPIIWFVLFMILFKFELTIEALIAMTISVGLTSDTIIHFGYKYFRSRYFGRTRKHALEIMFFYASVPAIISATVLMIVFLLLTFTQLPSLQLIGAYGAVLMFISLLSDLFILPVLLLVVDKKETNLETQTSSTI
ncbi:MAG: hypothetical protein JZU62_06295 [Sulfuricurvum sp.]|uniref:hypothetical protein n=1 Tax=Sulfuricurvum sp. TaxID=2025608 RepID=UPI0025FF1932|nr:hypothetical protein [Sulfuricurvum sp.]MBV5321277.1 hypothetical protein [Sulfuricurvum sp.]